MLTNKEIKAFHLILLAGGRGVRLGAHTPKQYINIAGKTLLRHGLDQFLQIPNLGEIVIVNQPEHANLLKESLEGVRAPIHTAIGGINRHDSVLAGLETLKPHINADDVVLIHDAARPLIHHIDITAVLAAMRSHNAATLATPVVDTLSYADSTNCASHAVDRDALWALQTPQAFYFKDIYDAHISRPPDLIPSDDTMLVQRRGLNSNYVKAIHPNFKITRPEDLTMAELLLNTRTPPHETRTGSGYDVHAFDDAMENVKFIRLCGLDIPFDRKLAGHSDADVGLHALTDAILGAIGEGDIGLHFPPSNMDFKNMDSAVFLRHACTLLKNKGGHLINADITLICERPKIGDHRDDMRGRVAEILETSVQRVNIKATTTEKLGFTGRMEGIAAQACVSISIPAADNER